MGFYAPAQIVGDARKNGVEVREIDVSFSFAQNTLEERSGKYCAVRLGFRQIDGFHWNDADEERLKQIAASFRDAMLALARARNPPPLEWIPGSRYARPGMTSDARKQEVDDWADRIVAARTRRPFTSLEDFARDTACPSAR